MYIRFLGDFPIVLFLLILFYLNPLILWGDTEPKADFFFFGMGNRDKYIYKDGVLYNALSKEIVREWEVRDVEILPSEYTVKLTTNDGERIQLHEDEESFWIIDSNNRDQVTSHPIELPRFEGHPYERTLRVLLHEILINIVKSKPVPNYLVYDKPWYRDAAMMAMCLEKTGNLNLIREWILNLREPFDRNNADHREADNLGEVLYLISLVSDKTHPLVQEILNHIPEFREGESISGMTDFSQHPVYQTKWLKYGLKALGLDDPFQIPEVYDSYSALFWMDYRNEHVEGGRFGDDAARNYPYLVWAEAHFYDERPPMPIREHYPLTWEANASQANYPGMEILSPRYVQEKRCAPHTWHAAEMFLLLLNRQD